MKVCQHDPNIYIIDQNILKILLSTVIFVVLKKSKISLLFSLTAAGIVFLSPVFVFLLLIKKKNPEIITQRITMSC